MSELGQGMRCGYFFGLPKIKKHSTVWKKNKEPTPQKFKEQLSVKNYLLEPEGCFVLVEYAEKEFTITAKSYFDTSMHIRVAIKHK